MMRLISVACLIGSAGAFAPQLTSSKSTKLEATGFEEVGGKPWDPMGFSKLNKLGAGKAKERDLFNNLFPDDQWLQEAEIKHGRQAMLAWTGIWATHEGGFGLGLHFDGMPVEPDWTKALGVFAAEQPAAFGAILCFIAIAEGESVGHTGDNFRGKSTKEPGNSGFDIFSLTKTMSADDVQRYKIVELKNGRAAMIAMASLFAFKSIPGSVPLMDLFGAS